MQRLRYWHAIRAAAILNDWFGEAAPQRRGCPDGQQWAVRGAAIKSGDRQLVFRLAGGECFQKPPGFAPTAGPSQGRVLRMTEFRRSMRTGRFCLCADQFGERETHLSGHSCHLGARFSLLPIFEGRNRLGDVLLQLFQFGERQCFQIVISHVVPLFRNVPVSIACCSMVPQHM